MSWTWDTTALTFDQTCWTFDGSNACDPSTAHSGSAGGSTGSKYKKAIRNSRYKKRVRNKKHVRIGKLEDVIIPDSKVDIVDLIDKVVNDVIYDAAKEAKKSHLEFPRQKLVELAKESKQLLKERERLAQLFKLTKIVYLKEVSRRRKKKAAKEAERVVQDAVLAVLQAETTARLVKLRQTKEQDELEAVLYILALIT